MARSTALNSRLAMAVGTLLSSLEVLECGGEATLHFEIDITTFVFWFDLARLSNSSKMVIRNCWHAISMLCTCLACIVYTFYCKQLDHRKECAPWIDFDEQQVLSKFHLIRSIFILEIDCVCHALNVMLSSSPPLRHFLSFFLCLLSRILNTLTFIKYFNGSVNQFDRRKKNAVDKHSIFGVWLTLELKCYTIPSPVAVAFAYGYEYIL